MAKYIHKMSFWNFLIYILTPIAALGEGAIIQFDGPKWLHGIVIVGFIVGGWVKFNIKDENNNDVADIFEKKK